ncbi:glycosyltransferase family 2 protein [Phyllobacterium sp. CCNWLW109]|uniref:glycosyltransferase family 2 protein n=1 Tax=Phyllobacterium sp. CCNWLW109 TaxID=3127479 RepID=UPI0030789657
MNSPEKRNEIEKRQPVSVVIPYFNQRADLVRCLNSLKRELTAGDEIIVVDDASTEAPDLAASANLPVRLVRHPHNKGPSKARNTGVELARNPLIAFMDADDICLPNRIPAQVAFLSLHPNFFGCVGDYYFERHQNFGHAKVMHDRLPEEVRRQLLCGRIFAAGSTLMVHKSQFLAIGGYDCNLRVYEDWDLLLRALRQSEIGHCGELVADILSSTRAADRDRRLSVLSTLKQRHMESYEGHEKRLFQQALAYEKASAYLRAHNAFYGIAALLEAFRIAPNVFLTRFMGRVLFGRT